MKDILGKKRILFVTHYFPPEGNAPASRVYEMAKHWVRHGHEVTVITGAPNCPNGVVYDGYKNSLLQRESVEGIKVIRVWTYIAANKGFLRRIVNYLSFMLSAVCAGMFIAKPDIVIATSPQFFCGWAGVLLKILRRLPLILEVRDIWPESIVVVGAMKNKRIICLFEKLEKIMYGAATHIVTVGKGYKMNIVSKGVEPEKITVITNGVDKELYHPRPADLALKKRYNLNSEFVCAYVGTIGMAAGLEVVLKAAKILKKAHIAGIKFMMIGDGAMREPLCEKARDSELDSVIFTGLQPKKLIPKFMASVDACLIHLKRNDLFKRVLPSKIFEAAAMAKPIILGVEGNAAELVNEAGAGICIEPENAEALVKAVRKLAEDKNLREIYGQKGYHYVTKFYDRRILAQAYLELIHVILAKHSVAYAKASVESIRKAIRENNQYRRGSPEPNEDRSPDGRLSVPSGHPSDAGTHGPTLR